MSQQLSCADIWSETRKITQNERFLQKRHGGHLGLVSLKNAKWGFRVAPCLKIPPTGVTLICFQKVLFVECTRPLKITRFRQNNAPQIVPFDFDMHNAMGSVSRDSIHITDIEFSCLSNFHVQISGLRLEKSLKMSDFCKIDMAAILDWLD